MRTRGLRVIGVEKNKNSVKHLFLSKKMEQEQSSETVNAQGQLTPAASSFSVRPVSHENLPSDMTSENIGEIMSGMVSQITDTKIKEEFEPLRRKFALEAIQDFVLCLCDAFSPNRNSPLGRYKRIVKELRYTDVEILDNKLFKGFKLFFAKYPNLTKAKVDKAACVPYSKNIFIAVGAFSETPEFSVVLRHLHNIRKILTDVDGGTDTVVLEEEAESDSAGFEKEDAYIEDIIETMLSHFKGLDFDDPKKMIAQMMEKGILTDIMDKAEKGMSSGEFDGVKFLSRLQSIIPKIVSKMAGGQASSFFGGK